MLANYVDLHHHILSDALILLHVSYVKKTFLSLYFVILILHVLPQFNYTLNYFFVLVRISPFTDFTSLKD